MKMSEELKKAQANMQPGVISVQGFLGSDTRPIVDIIQHDEEAFRLFGLEWEAVGAKLRELLKKGSDGLGEPTTVANRWLIRVDETRGTLPSPWEDGIFHKVNAEVQLLAAGQRVGNPLIYNELCIHLLEKFHFLQGKGSPFRLEPATLKEVLGF